MATETVNRLKDLLMGQPGADGQPAEAGYLKRSGQSVEQFARDIGVTRTSVYYYLNDKARPSLSTLVKICEKVGIPLSEGVTYCTPREIGRQPQN